MVSLFQSKGRIKDHFFFGFVAICLSLVFHSCNKSETAPRNDVYLKIINNDSLGIFLDNTITEVIPMPDKSFWIHYRLWYAEPFRDKFEHYDEDFKLLKTVHYNDYKFGKFIVNGNNDIVVSAIYMGSTDQRGYHFIQFDHDFNILKINKTLNDHLSLINQSYHSVTARLNQQYIMTFHTSDGHPGSDSSRIITVAYKDPLNDSRPEWVDENRYPDFTQGIYSNSIADMASDGIAAFYVLGYDSDFSFILRKHDKNGLLIWQKKIKNSERVQDRFSKIYVETDRVVVSLANDKVYIFDQNGNMVEKTLAYSIAGTLIPTLHGNGYIAASDTTFPSAKFATLLKFDRQFNILKVKRYGNQGTNNPSEAAARLARTSAGKIVVTGFVEGTNINQVNLMLFKVDDELELTE